MKFLRKGKTDMIRTNYEITALQPIFTGSDEDTGIIRTLRREKVCLANPVRHVSAFKTENERRLAILEILESVWTQIDFENMSSSRMMRIWDEFSSKILASTRVRTKEQFLNLICQSFGIRAIRNTDIVGVIQKFGDVEFLDTIREELQFLVLLIRKHRAEKKAGITENKENMSGQYSLFIPPEQDNPPDQEIVFEKHFDYIPYVSGNSIRGILRRLVMRDFCKIVGITKLDKQMYHQLFTGGNITDSTAYEDIARREEYIANCPMIGLFGSAIGNMTIEGELKVGGARPICREHGNGGVSFWELLGTEFGTRRDDSKLERDIEITNANPDEKNQMKYGYEVFIPGTKFSHCFICTTHSELVKSAYWHVLELFRANPIIGGSSSVGNGLISQDYEIEEKAGDMYVKYLKEKKETILEYFGKI